VSEHQPEPWESGAAAPFLWIETAQGNVEVWALGEDRFGITSRQRDAADRIRAFARISGSQFGSLTSG
jgi:hypothetical protein